MKTVHYIALSAVETWALQHGKEWNPATYFKTFVALFVAQFFLVALYNIFIYPIYRSPIRNLPGPKTKNPLIGHAIDVLGAEGPNDKYLEWTLRWPDEPLLRFQMPFGTEWVIVNSLKANREILHGFGYALSKPGWWVRVVGEVAGFGLAMQEGEYHKTARKTMNIPFSFANIKRLLPLMNDKSVETSDQVRIRQGKDRNEPVDVYTLFAQTALDIIGIACLGIELQSLSIDSESGFYYQYNKILNLDPVGTAVFLFNMVVPCRTWLPVKENREFVHAMNEVKRKILDKLHEKKKEILGDQGRIKQDFLEEKNPDILTFVVLEMCKDNKWTDDDALGHLMNVMAGGYETTAGALGWSLLSCCRQPEIQKRLRDEIRTHIPHNGPPSNAELEKLKYMDYFIKETLRCFSPIIWVSRTPVQPIRLQSVSNTVVMPGTTLLINPTSMHYNPKVWGPDAHEFNPDRHDPNHPSGKLHPDSRDPYAYEAFAHGPRNCIGKAFALLEMKSVLTTLLRRWEVSRGWDANGEKLPAGVEWDPEMEHGVDEKEDLSLNPQKKLLWGIRLKNHLSLKPSNGLWVRFKEIE